MRAAKGDCLRADIRCLKPVGMAMDCSRFPERIEWIQYESCELMAEAAESETWHFWHSNCVICPENGRSLSKPIQIHQNHSLLALKCPMSHDFYLSEPSSSTSSQLASLGHLYLSFRTGCKPSTNFQSLSPACFDSLNTAACRTNDILRSNSADNGNHRIGVG